MALETGTYISDLDSANPTATDDVSEGDDHIRLLKSTIKATFPNISGAVTPSHTILNQIANGQFAFPATQNASADANTLDDYEEGDFTAGLSAVTSGTITLQTAQDTLCYTKIGRVVWVNGRIKVSSVSSPVGQLQLTGLPYTVADQTDSAEVMRTPVFGEGLSTIADGFNVLGQIGVSGNTIVVLDDMNQNNIANEVIADSAFSFNFFYLTA